MTNAGILLDGNGGGQSAFAEFVPTGLADLKQSYTYNPKGKLNGAQIEPRIPAANNVVLLDDGTGGAATTFPRRLADAIRALLSFPKPVTGSVDNPFMLGAVPPTVMPPEGTIASVVNFYAQDGRGDQRQAPLNNNALTANYVRK